MAASDTRKPGMAFFFRENWNWNWSQPALMPYACLIFIEKPCEQTQTHFSLSSPVCSCQRETACQGPCQAGSCLPASNWNDCETKPLRLLGADLPSTNQPMGDDECLQRTGSLSVLHAASSTRIPCKLYSSCAAFNGRQCIGTEQENKGGSKWGTTPF